MTNALMTTFKTDNYDDIAALTGAYVPSSTYLPSLTVNKKVIKEGKKVLVDAGTYKITQSDVSVYAETVLFRPFINTFQYMQYDPDENKFLNKSIIIKNFREQAIDELGGLKCGHVSFKQRETLKNAGLPVPDRNTKCYRNIYGLLTMTDAVTETGEETSVTNLPILWRTSGDNYNAANNALKTIETHRHFIFQHNLFLGVPKEATSGSNTYYVMEAKAVMTEELPFTDEDQATFKMFQESIDRENKYVAAKWRDAKKNAEPFDMSVMKELELSDSLDDL